MKIFIDTANAEEIRKAHSWGIIDGVTTNPTLISKEKGSFEGLIKEITSIVDGPISVEAIAAESEAMIKEARGLARISKSVVVKIPMTSEGLKAVKVLSREGVKTNVTLVFSANQGILAAKAGATYVSPFIGRLDDIGQDGMQVVKDMVQVFRTHSLKTQVIVASIRHPLHVMEAAKTGAEVATIPYKVLEQMLKHPLTDAGIERFLADWKSFKGKDE
jgi:transaldolase